MSRFSNYIKKLFEAGFSNFPSGWDSDSVKSWVKTFQKHHDIPKSGEGFFDACVLHMTDKFGEDGAKRFCASAKDEYFGSTYWRGKEKTPEQVKKDVKKHKNV